MTKVWIAVAKRTDESELVVTVVGATKEAAERALRECIDEQLGDVFGRTDTDAEAIEMIEMNREMYDFMEAYEVPLHR